MQAAATDAAVLDRPVRAAPARLSVRLRSITYLAEQIRGFEFVALDGGPLPPFTAGAHIDVHLPGGWIRQYSLCNDPAQRHRYIVAVLRDAQGRGGSIAMHDQLHAGSIVEISLPRNHFSLSERAERYLFVAGGIGITPIMSMLAAARALGKPFHLYYGTRSPERTAFLDELRPLVECGQATLHHDGGHASNGLDLRRLLAPYVPGTHLYYCGPSGFLDAVADAAAGWPAQAVHCERFSAPSTQGTEDAAGAFDVALARSGLHFTVAPGQSIVDVLRAHGVAVDVSCEQGYCGTCMTRYLGGHPIHRDSVLDDDDRREFVMICCCRAKDSTLVLDM